MPCAAREVPNTPPKLLKEENKKLFSELFKSSENSLLFSSFRAFISSSSLPI
jgi:hypothetical protein